MRATSLVTACILAAIPAAAPAADASKVFRYAFQVAETGFDPAEISDKDLRWPDFKASKS